MKYPSEINALQLQALLKGNSNNSWSCGNSILPTCTSSPSIELCRGLLALKDTDLTGRLLIEHIPALVNLMSFWKTSFRRCGTHASTSGVFTKGSWASKISSYCLRGLLWTAGVTASNKVIEALVGRFTKNRQITLEGYILALIRIHLAHGKFQEKKNLHKF